MTNPDNKVQPSKKNGNTLDNGRLPPQAREFEKVLLGVMLIEEKNFYSIREKLHSGLFYVDSHRLIYEAITELANTGKPIDILSVSQELKRTSNLDKVGGAFFVSHLTSAVSFGERLEYIVAELHNCYLKRQLISVSTDTILKCYESPDSAKEIIFSNNSEIKILQEEAIEEKVITTDTIYTNTMDAVFDAKANSGILGIPTNIPELTKSILGLQPGHIYVIAARPRIGKSALMKSLILHCVLEKIKCKIFSLEMTATQMMMGMLTEVTEIDNQQFSTGDISDEQWAKIQSYRGKIVPYLEIDDKPAITIQYLESRVRKFVAGGGQLIAIDYLQLMQLSPADKKNKIREQEVAFLTGNIKRIAKEYKVPIIELSQLSRDIEKRSGDKRPQLSDLRESGAIEQDAEVIIFIQRPEADGAFEDKNGSSTKGKAKLILAKNRFGPCIDIKVKFTANITRYSSLTIESNLIEKQEELWEI